MRSFGVAAVVMVFMLSLGTCQNPKPIQKTESVAKPASVSPDDSSYEILVRHLLRRIADLNNEVQDAKNDAMKRENKCIEDEIAILEGRNHPADEQARMADIAVRSQATGKDMLESIDRMIQRMLDSEAAISEHNHSHPDKPWADVEDVLKQTCGDCSKARALRNAQLAEEAKH